MLGKFSESLRGNLTKLQRLKVVALVTIEVSRKAEIFLDIAEQQTYRAPYPDVDYSVYLGTCS